MNGMDFIYSLDFEKYAILDEIVDTESGVDAKFMIEDWEFQLVLKLRTKFSQLPAETRVIRLFDQSGAYRRVDRHRGFDYSTGDLVYSQNGPTLCVLSGLRGKWVEKQSLDRP
jgi:hypothetical protein